MNGVRLVLHREAEEPGDGQDGDSTPDSIEILVVRWPVDMHDEKRGEMPPWIERHFAPGITAVVVLKHFWNSSHGQLISILVCRPGQPPEVQEFRGDELVRIPGLKGFSIRADRLHGRFAPLDFYSS